MRSDSGAQLTGRRSLLIAAASLAVIAVFIPVYRMQSLSWLQATAAAALFVLPCVILSWVVWRWLMRPREPVSPVHILAMHTAVAAAFSASWTIVFSSVVYLVRPDDILAFMRGGAVWQFVWGLLIYGVLAQAARTQKRLRERELAAVGAELQALRAQLNPHFLFNTLHSLMQLTREDPVATERALERFGELMRYVLSAGREAISDVALEDELGFVRNYLELERLRLGDRLRVIEDINPETLELAVPPLLLQPLVENAIRHGLAPRREGGTIRVKARADETKLVIEVGDDGQGAEPGACHSSDGLGLKVAARQLKARFPTSGALEIETAPHAGFTARLSMPLRVPMRGSLEGHRPGRR